MKISTMRSIDFWAGIPLCAFATTLLRIWKHFRAAAPRPLCRVLFIELSERVARSWRGPLCEKRVTSLRPKSSLNF